MHRKVPIMALSLTPARWPRSLATRGHSAWTCLKEGGRAWYRSRCPGLGRARGLGYEYGGGYMPPTNLSAHQVSIHSKGRAEVCLHCRAPFAPQTLHCTFTHSLLCHSEGASTNINAPLKKSFPEFSGAWGWMGGEAPRSSFKSLSFL